MSVEIWDRNAEGDGWVASGKRKNDKDKEMRKDEPDIMPNIGQLPDLGKAPAIPNKRDERSEDEDARIRQGIIDKDKLEIN